MRWLLAVAAPFQPIRLGTECNRDRFRLEGLEPPHCAARAARYNGPPFALNEPLRAYYGLAVEAVTADVQAVRKLDAHPRLSELLRARNGKHVARVLRGELDRVVPFPFRRNFPPARNPHASV